MTRDWLLLADLDALLSQEGWQEGSASVTMMCLRISEQTGIGPVRRHGVRNEAGTTWRSEINFLRSRDAAAMLERALLAKLGDDFDIRIWRDENGDGYRCHISWSKDCYVQTLEATEPAARTSAALEVGFRVGLWPVRKHG